MADVITIPLTPAQFIKAQCALDVAPGVSHTGDDHGGTVHTADLDFSYTYDEVSFYLTPTAKRGLARFASDAAIKSHIEALLA